MKNQYFGDKRDLFKYDLALNACKGVELGLTFVPMLTAPDRRTDGNQIDYAKAKAGYNNSALKCFLRNCVDRGERDVQQLTKFVSSTGIKYHLYQSQEVYFTQGGRRAYISGIGDECLEDVLALLDPDNGLETKRSNKRHLLFSEIELLRGKMGNGSVLMIYQHFPREEHQGYLAKRTRQLGHLSSSQVYWISDNEIIFFFLAKAKNVQDKLLRVLREYKVEYPLLTTNAH
ncbi:MAG: hypothetical protein WBD30_11900 [Bacteroidota bacterium]